MKRPLDIDYIKECFNVDAENGILIWKVRPRHHFKSNRSFSKTNTQYAGKIAGHITNNPNAKKSYCCIGISINGKQDIFLFHRVMYALHHGVDPLNGVVDHIDGDICNNRISNLRLCTQRENTANQIKTRNSINRLKGAYFHKRIKKWQSSICVNYKQIHLGYYDNEIDAHNAYVQASAKFNKEFLNSGT